MPGVQLVADVPHSQASRTILPLHHALAHQPIANQGPATWTLILSDPDSPLHDLLGNGAPYFARRRHRLMTQKRHGIQYTAGGKTVDAPRASQAAAQYVAGVVEVGADRLVRTALQERREPVDDEDLTAAHGRQRGHCTGRVSDDDGTRPQRAR